MLYKKISLPILPFAGLLLAGGSCPNGKRAATSSVLDSKAPVQHHKDKQPQVSISSSGLLGSISYMGGAITNYLLHIKGKIMGSKPVSELAFVWLSDGAKLSDQSPVVQNAIRSKNDVGKFLLQPAGEVIYWNKAGKAGTGTKEWILPVSKEVGEKLTSNKYLHTLIPSGASAQKYLVSAAPAQMDIAGKDSPLPDYQNIGLEAISAVEQQQSGGTGWFLKGRIAGSLPQDPKVGFILVKEGVNPCSLVQEEIAKGWPTETTTLLNGELIIVPGRLRGMSDSPIIGDLSNDQAPIQGGDFKIICYLIQNQHCYLSQMQHILSDVTESSLSQEGVPPSITFTGNSHGLKVPGLAVSLEKVSGQVQNIKTSDFKFEYSVNGEVEPCPDQLKPYVIAVQGDAIWRTDILQDLFKRSYESNSSAIVSDDGAVCLIAQPNQTLDESCIDFFSQGGDYQYFTCLFDTNDHKLKFYTNKEALSIEEKEIIAQKEVNTAQPKPEQPKEEQPKPEQPKKELKVTLEGEGAHITFTPHVFRLQKAKVTYALPQLKLEPSDFDKNKLKHCGFVIAKAGELVPSKMADHSPIIQNFINDNKGISYDKKFLIFKENPQKDQLVKNLYDAYNNNEEEGYNTVEVSYWAQYKDQIIWSKPVSMKIIWK